MEQVAEPCNTPLGINLNKPKRNDEECQDKSQPIKVVVRIFEVGSPFPANDNFNYVLTLLTAVYHISK